jgi:hypothetical protein
MAPVLWPPQESIPKDIADVQESIPKDHPISIDINAQESILKDVRISTDADDGYSSASVEIRTSFSIDSCALMSIEIG